jgi:hypothetical protein
MDMNRLSITLTLALLLLGVPASADGLTGMVVDYDSKPVTGAHVYVYTAVPRVGVSALCPSCYRDCGKHETVDGQGEFRLKELDPSLVFDLLAVADGYEPAFARRVDPRKGAVRITLTPRSSADADRLIMGTVLDPEDKPVVGAMVEPSGLHVERPRPGGGITRSTGYGNIPGLDKLSITNARGEFALRVPEVGAKLDVRVTARNLAPSIERLLAPGESRKIRMKEGATITGRVLRDGRAAVGVTVAFVQKNRNSSGFLGIQEIGTDENGRFVMTSLGANETYVVYGPMERNAKAAVTPKVVDVGPDETSADAGILAIEKGRRIAGTVIVPDGVSIPPKSRMMLSTELAGDVSTVEIGDDHKFAFEGAVVADSVRLHLRMPGLRVSRDSTGYDPKHDQIVIPPAACDWTDVRVVLEKSAR